MKPLEKISLFCVLMISLFFSACTGKNQSEANRPPNILFIAVDDLRPEINTFGAEQIISPSIDRLAAEGITFNRSSERP